MLTFSTMIFSLYISELARADNYFDPALLLQSDGTDSIPVDLSQFSKANKVAEGNYNLTVYVNDNSFDEIDIAFEKNNTGEVVPVLTPALLAAMSIDVDNIPAWADLPPDTPIKNLVTDIPDARLVVDMKTLTLKISIPQIHMHQEQAGSIPDTLLDDGISAVFANYFVNVGQNQQRGRFKSRHQNAFFNSYGGINLDAWRLRTNYTYSYMADDQQSSSAQGTWSNTVLSRGIKGINSTLKLGEINTGTAIFDGIPMRGIQLATNPMMLPSSLRGYAPVISGVANSNATVTVRQNGAVVYQAFVPPGNFTIRDITNNAIAGDLDVMIEEEDGTKRVFTQAYSSLPLMLRPQQWTYELSAGQYYGGQTTDSRQSHFLLGSAIYGVSNDLTVYGGVIVAQQYLASAFGAGFSLGEYGALSSDITVSQAQYPDKTYQGQSYRVRYSKSLLSTGTSFDLTALRYSTHDFFTLGDFNTQGYALQNGAVPWLKYKQRASFQTSISQSLGQYGSLYLRGSKIDYWESHNSNTHVALGYQTTYQGISFDVNYGIDRLESKNGNWPINHQMNFSASVPFSIFSQDSEYKDMSASYRVSSSKQGGTSQQIGLNGSALASRLSYGVHQNYNGQGEHYSGSVNASYSGSDANVAGSYSYSPMNRSLNLNLNGAVIAHSNGITLSPIVGDSFAIVNAKQAVGAHLNSGNEFDRWGNAIVPILAAYDKNTINMDVTTLPENTTVPKTSVTVYPTEGAIIARNIPTHVGYQAIFTISGTETVPPFGAIASLTGTEKGLPNTGIVGEQQSLYMSGLPDTGSIEIKWGQEAKQCVLNYNGLASMTVTEEAPIRQVNVHCVTNTIEKII